MYIMKDLSVWVFCILLASVLIQLLNVKSALNNNKDKVNNTNSYKLKSIMTDYERYFYNIFVELERELGVRIVPQVNLAAILKKESNNYYINELFRNIDFGIFTRDYEQLLLLIEINDSSHRLEKRKIRDRKVDDILANANVRLIKFYSNYPNKKEYVKERIKSEIKNKFDLQ